MFSLYGLLSVLLVGLAYYAGAWLGVTQTITPEGIAIIWPPNAVLLAAFLLRPPSYWPWFAAAALVAEVIADLPGFPLWAAVAFGFINIFETLLAAWLIRWTVGEHFDFDSLKRGAYFFLYGPLLASATAAMLGALCYVLLGRSDSSYWSLWRLWWFGDALGLLLLTPLLVVLGRWLEHGLPRFEWRRVAELTLLCTLLVVLGINAFPQGGENELGFHLTLTVLLPFGVWAAVRFGVRGASWVVLLIATMATGFMVRGIHPYTDLAPQYAVWLMQEYLAVMAVMTTGLALLIYEIRSQRDVLEWRVIERTRELQRANRRLTQIASTDYLTGIANRRHFYEVARRELARCKVSGAPLSLLMLDLDHFKRVNDDYGHDAGDSVLQQVIQRVQTTVRPLDMLGRYGGEEFLLALPETPLEEAAEIAERIRERVEQLPIKHDGESIHVTVSIGLVEQADSGSGLEALINRADQALYRAKSAGRNRVEVVQGAASA
ncbi:MAG: diguanylate cyclase [Pseudomonadota bacterium]